MLNVPSLYRRRTSNLSASSISNGPATNPPSSDPNESLAHTTLALSTETTVHVWQAASPRATIILQHGYAEYATRYLTSHNNVIRHFLDAGYTVYAMDIHGHGQSPGTRSVAHIGHAVTDHLEVRRIVRQREGGPVILFGHSLGGLITAGSMVRDPEGVHGVVLTGPAFPGPLPYLARLVLGVAARCIPCTSIPGRSVPIEGLTRNVSELDKYFADPMYSKKSICFLVAATALDVADTVRFGVRNWNVPTLVLHGNADPYCDLEASNAFWQAIKSEDKDFVTLEGGRHELLHDCEGDVVLGKTLAWIETHV